MNERAGSSSGIGWGRARGAYAALIAGHDPFAGDLTDLRPGFTALELEAATDGGGLVIVSGPGDLIELRALVERLTGPGTWPAFDLPAGFVVVETRTDEIELDRPSPAVSLVMAMEHQIEDRSRAWRTWKTVIESLAVGIPAGTRISIEAVLVARS